MLSLVRNELCLRMDSGFNGLQGEVHGLKAEIQDLKSDVHSLRSDFLRLEAGNSRMHLLLEEQNANNRIVLEGLQALWQRQDRVEERIGQQ